MCESKRRWLVWRLEAVKRKRDERLRSLNDFSSTCYQWSWAGLGGFYPVGWNDSELSQCRHLKPKRSGLSRARVSFCCVEFCWTQVNVHWSKYKTKPKCQWNLSIYTILYWDLIIELERTIMVVAFVLNLSLFFLFFASFLNSINELVVWIKAIKLCLLLDWIDWIYFSIYGPGTGTTTWF